jgi:hypothetical protein
MVVAAFVSPGVEIAGEPAPNGPSSLWGISSSGVEGSISIVGAGIKGYTGGGPKENMLSGPSGAVVDSMSFALPLSPNRWCDTDRSKVSQFVEKNG